MGCSYRLAIPQVTFLPLAQGEGGRPSGEVQRFAPGKARLRIGL